MPVKEYHSAADLRAISATQIFSHCSFKCIFGPPSVRHDDDPSRNEIHMEMDRSSPELSSNNTERSAKSRTNVHSGICNCATLSVRAQVKSWGGIGTVYIQVTSKYLTFPGALYVELSEQPARDTIFVLAKLENG